MADLVRIAGQAGFDAPQTLLASGNVLFGTGLSGPDAADRLAAAILTDLGLATEVLVRDRDEIGGVIAANPFPDQAQDAPSRLMVTFLTGQPQAELNSLADVCVAGEQIRLGPGCLYIWIPEGAGTSKLGNALLERRLKVRATMRNWNTVGKLSARLAAAAVNTG